MSGAAVELARVSKAYPPAGPWWRSVRTAPSRGVRGLSLTIGRGEAWLLAGPNGAGKTTTIHCILGLLRPDAGHISVLGTTPLRARARIGYQPEIFFTYPYLSGRETLRFYGRLAGMASGQAAARAEVLLQAWDLADAGDRRVGTYSKGMAQRLGLAQSLVHEPDVVIWDEPTSGLDPIARRHVIEEVARLRAAGRTVLVSTHALGEVENVCDHVAIVAGGQCLASGRVSALCEQGGHAGLEAFYFTTLGKTPQRAPHA